MITKDQLRQQVEAIISNYPTAAMFYQAGDPRMIAQLEANITMIHMLSVDQDIAASEPFVKARDVTVLADAAIKGILPFATPKKVVLDVENPSASPLTITSGKTLLDPQGRAYVVETGATVGAGLTAQITAVQKSQNDFQHTVSVNQPFYTIQIPEPESGRKIAAIGVKQGSEVFDYIPDFVNVEIGQKMFHLQTDELRRLFVKFGAANIAGYQPAIGEVFDIIVTESEGAFELATGAQFTVEYIINPVEAQLRITLNEVTVAGSDPMDINTIREVTTYPSTYDESAVYQGNFDYLIRRKLTPVKFLSVWNEQREEEVRGANIDNINRLFVSIEKDGWIQSELEAEAERIIKNADNSYRVTFVPSSVIEIPVAVTAYIAPVYDFAAVSQKIKDLIIAKYGEDSPFAKRGDNRVQYKILYNLLEDNVAELRDRVADLVVSVTDSGAEFPEQYRYVSLASLTVNVVSAG